MLLYFVIYFFFCKQKTAYEMRISDWSSDVCSSDLATGCSKARSPEFLRFLQQHWLKSRWWRHRRPGALPPASTGKEWTLSGHMQNSSTQRLDPSRQLSLPDGHRRPPSTSMT